MYDPLEVAVVGRDHGGCGERPQREVLLWVGTLGLDMEELRDR